MRLMRFFAFVVLTSHWAACLFYLIARYILDSVKYILYSIFHTVDSEFTLQHMYCKWYGPWYMIYGIWYVWYMVNGFVPTGVRPHPFSAFVVLASHWAACLFYLIARFRPTPTSSPGFF
jgi:hypothetical protein